MAKPSYRKIYPLIWNDEKFQELSGDEQRIMLYCLTGKHTNRIGLFCFSTAEAAETLKIKPARFQELFANVCRRLAWPYDSKQRVLYIPSWWKWNHPENPNVLKGNLDDILTVPQTPLRETFASNLTHLEKRYHSYFRERLANVAETLPQTVPKQQQQQEQEQYQQQQKQNHAAAGFLDSSQSPGDMASLLSNRGFDPGDAKSYASLKPSSLIVSAIAVFDHKHAKSPYRSPGAGLRKIIDNPAGYGIEENAAGEWAAPGQCAKPLWDEHIAEDKKQIAVERAQDEENKKRKPIKLGKSAKVGAA